MKRLLFLTLTACSMPTQPVVATPWSVQFGIGSHYADQYEVPQITALHLQHVRVTFYTQTPDPAYWDHFRERLARYDAAGIQPLIVVHDFPSWWSAPFIMQALDSLYPGRTWQVGNEEDAKGMSGAQYAEHMKRIAKLVPADRLVSMGLARELGPFLMAYRAAGGPTLSAWAIHSYGLFLADGLAARVRAARRALGPDVPLWVTEIGVNHVDMMAAWTEAKDWTQSAIDQAQSFELSQVMLAAIDLPIQRLYLYQLSDDDDVGYGIMAADRHTERPAAIMLRTWMNMNRAWLRARAAGDLVE